jgi:hypothetical protein
MDEEHRWAINTPLSTGHFLLSVTAQRSDSSNWGRKSFELGKRHSFRLPFLHSQHNPLVEGQGLPDLARKVTMLGYPYSGRKHRAWRSPSAAANEPVTATDWQSQLEGSCLPRPARHRRTRKVPKHGRC